MGKNKNYEITAGIVITPREGEIEIPPQSTMRKGIVEGELVIRTDITLREVAEQIETARRTGITEIPIRRSAQRDEGR